jgi:hypothetical protein
MAKIRIAIPKLIRAILGLPSAVEIKRREEARQSAGPKPDDRFSKLLGHAGKGMTTDEIMALTRGED